ncbi:MAG: hypothetical protein ACRDH2_00800 [Anaerolineales bacterium]
MTPHTRLQGKGLIAARFAWFVVAALVLGLAVATLPDILREASTIAPADQRTFIQLSSAEARTLDQLGVSVDVYVAFVLAWILSPVFLYLLVAGLIFWRRADDGVAFLMSLMLVAIGAAIPYLAGITVFRPAWQTAVYFVRALGVFLLLLLVYLFPNGRFVPAWTRLVAVFWAAWMLFWLVFPESPLGFLDAAGALTPVGLVFMVLGFGVGVYAQAYRYRRISNPLQRQQAKVFAFGFAATLVIYLVAVTPYFLIPAVREPGWPYLAYGLVVVPLLTRLAFALVPLVIGFAILRYRLWDIDIIIRRTLIYGVLTSALALIYALTVVSLQGLFPLLTGQRQSELSTVLSTLAIAALFVPLRARVQDLIDRRFYRRKYDAAKTLADFSATVRDEVDVNRLTDRLVRVIEETVQPAHVSLWLKTATDRADGDGQPPAFNVGARSGRSSSKEENSL